MPTECDETFFQHPRHALFVRAIVTGEDKTIYIHLEYVLAENDVCDFGLDTAVVCAQPRRENMDGVQAGLAKLGLLVITNGVSR